MPRLCVDPFQVLVSTPVQLFFAWRIKILGGPKLMLAIIAFAAFGSLGAPDVFSKPRSFEF